MKISFWKDFGTIAAFVVLDEGLHMMLFDLYSPPRSRGAAAAFLADGLLSALTLLIFYLRYKPYKTALLYGGLIGLMLLLPVHLIQFPTATNLLIVGYKIGMAILLVVIFTRILRNQVRASASG